MTITHDVCLNDHRHNDYHYDHQSPPNGTYCHSDLEESNNDFIQVFIISIIVFFPHVIVYLNNGFHQHHCLYLCLYCYHHTIIFMIDHHNHYHRLPLNIVRNQNPPRFLEVGGLVATVQARKVTHTSAEAGTQLLCRISMVRIFCAGYLW